MKIFRNIILIGIAYICFPGCEKQDVVLKNRYLLHCLLIEGETPRISVQRPLETYPEYPFDVIYYDQSPVVDKINLNKGNSSYNLLDFDFRLIDDLKLEDINSSYGNFPVANYRVGYYINDNVEVFPGETFDISIDLADPNAMGTQIEETLKAKTTIPNRVNFNITQTDSIFENGFGFVDTTILYNITFEDPEETNDYYYLLVYTVLPGDNEIEDVNIDSLWLYHDYNRREGSPTDPQLSGVWLTDPTDREEDEIFSLAGPFFSDEKFNGEHKLFQASLDINSSGYLFVDLYHLSEEFYNYYYAMAKQNQSQWNIYAEPVQVYSNVENGLGIFAGASVSRKMIEIESKPD